MTDHTNHLRSQSGQTLELPPNGSASYSMFSRTHKGPSPKAPKLNRTFRFKYVAERILAALILIPALPVIGVLCCIVRISSRGPAIYKQTRVGMGGKEFAMYKIRSMVVDAEASSGPAWSTPSDPRITRVGKVLRFLHLDELPQLFNVIKGDMSVIGPRPERPGIVEYLLDHVDGYAERLRVKPGITGLAQIYLPPDETLDCVRKKICFDRAYIETATLTVDAQIWLCTLLRIVGIRKGRGPRWVGLDKKYSDVQVQCNKIMNKPSEMDGFAVGSKPVAFEQKPQSKGLVPQRSASHCNGSDSVNANLSSSGRLVKNPK